MQTDAVYKAVQPCCLSCGEPTEKWVLCDVCTASARRTHEVERQRRSARLDGNCRYCGSVFPEHRCVMR